MPMRWNLSDIERAFLHAIVEAGGRATRRQLGGVTNEGDVARQNCRRLGYAFFDRMHPAGWIITDKGREALESHAERAL